MKNRKNRVKLNSNNESLPKIATNQNGPMVVRPASYKKEMLIISLISDILINIIFLISDLNIVWAIGYDFMLMLTYAFDYPITKLTRIKKYSLSITIVIIVLLSATSMWFQHVAYGGYYPATVLMVFVFPTLFLVALHEYQHFLNKNYMHIDYTDNETFGEVFKFHFVVSANLVYGYFLSIPGREPYYHRLIEPSRLSMYMTKQFSLTPSEIVVSQAKNYETISGLCIVGIGLIIAVAILRAICDCVNVLVCNQDFRIKGKNVSLFRFIPFGIYGVTVLLLSTLGYRIYSMGRYVELFYFGLSSVLLLIFIIHYLFISHILSKDNFKHIKAASLLLQLLIVLMFFWPIVIYMIELKSDFLGRYYYPSIALINVGQLLLMVKSLHIFYKTTIKQPRTNLNVNQRMTKRHLIVTTVLASIALLILICLSRFFISKYESHQYKVNLDFTYDVQDSNQIKIVALDDKNDIVTIQNKSSDRVDISNWEIISDRGLQTYTFAEQTVLNAGELAEISNENYEWQNSTKTEQIDYFYIWNDEYQDNAILRNAEGIVVDIYPNVNYQNPYMVNVTNIDLQEMTATLKNNSAAGISLRNWTFKIDRTASHKFATEELSPFEEIVFSLDGIPELLSIDLHTFMLYDDHSQLLFALIEDEKSPYYVDIICLDKVKEMVYVQNNADYDIELNGWVLMSALGKQSFTFPDIKLKPGEIISIGGNNDNNPNIVWQDFVWNNEEQDDAILIDAYGNYISAFVVYE